MLEKRPVLYTLAFFGCLFFISILLSIYVPPKQIEIVKEVEVIKEVEKIIYEDKIEYRNINIFVSGEKINYIVSFYKENNSEEYEKILKFYDQYTKSRSITKTIVEQSIKIGVPIHLSFGLVERESGFNPKRENRNSNGSWDRGLFQLNSSSRPKWKLSDYHNIEKNTIEGLSFLKWLMDKLKNHDLAIAAYNAGYYSINQRKIPYTTSIHVFDIKNNILKYDINFNTILLPSLENIKFDEGQIILHI